LGLFGIISIIALIFTKHITKENRIKIGNEFRHTIAGLASSNNEVKMASAILLRRFFDKNSELGVGGAPYAKDALDVISSILKSHPTSNFQKVLADGIRFAPNHHLQRADFQGANLSKALLSKKEREDIDFTGADFFQADLSGATFKGATLNDAQFYEATLYGTKLNNTQLKNANFMHSSLHDVTFRDADLTNANFEGSTLINVDFTGAIITGAKFKGVDGYGLISCPNEIKSRESIPGCNIFISRPGVLDTRQELFLTSVKEVLSINGFNPIELNRGEYDQQKVLTKLIDRIDSCSAMIVFGFRSTHVIDGAYRYSTEDVRLIKNEFLSTPWNHVEMGMASARKIPILALVDDGVNDGIFASDIKDSALSKLAMTSCLGSGKIIQWAHACITVE